VFAVGLGVGLDLGTGLDPGAGVDPGAGTAPAVVHAAVEVVVIPDAVARYRAVLKVFVLLLVQLQVAVSGLVVHQLD
jgi:hypothetical protein